MKRIFLFLLCSFLAACSATKSKPEGVKINEVYEMKHYFDECKVDGCFILYSSFNNMYVTYNEQRGQKGFLPASTFKILNSLIALETGVAKDENLVIKWDGIERSIPAWNQDQTMRSAFKVSCVPYYQEIARRIGYKRMKEYVKLAGYGHMDIHKNNIDSFWLTGKSRITPFEQVDFLNRLYNYKLPFSRRNIDIVKDIMKMDSTRRYVMSGKTGWAQMDGKDIGWLVGSVTNLNDGHAYYYATNIEAKDPDPDKFTACRKDITLNIMREIGCL